MAAPSPPHPNYRGRPRRQPKPSRRVLDQLAVYQDPDLIQLSSSPEVAPRASVPQKRPALQELNANTISIPKRPKSTYLRALQAGKPRGRRSTSSLEGRPLEEQSPQQVQYQQLYQQQQPQVQYQQLYQQQQPPPASPPTPQYQQLYQQQQHQQHLPPSPPQIRHPITPGPQRSTTYRNGARLRGAHLAAGDPSALSHLAFFEVSPLSKLSAENICAHCGALSWPAERGTGRWACCEDGKVKITTPESPLNLGSLQGTEREFEHAVLPLHKLMKDGSEINGRWVRTPECSYFMSNIVLQCIIIYHCLLWER